MAIRSSSLGLKEIVLFGGILSVAAGSIAWFMDILCSAWTPPVYAIVIMAVGCGVVTYWCVHDWCMRDWTELDFEQWTWRKVDPSAEREPVWLDDKFAEEDRLAARPPKTVPKNSSTTSMDHHTRHGMRFVGHLDRARRGSSSAILDTLVYWYAWIEHGGFGMKTLTVMVRIEHGKLLIEAPAPADLVEGEHLAVIQIADAVRPTQELLLPTPWAWSHESGSSTFGREEIYGDDGR